jgi:hypothetical protein
MKLGYARVSTEDQRLDLQRARLTDAGCGRLFEEKISGAARQRPALEQLLRELRADDVLVVTRLDRLARSTAELLRLVEAIREKDPMGRRVHGPGRVRVTRSDPVETVGWRSRPHPQHPPPTRSLPRCSWRWN